MLTFIKESFPLSFGGICSSVIFSTLTTLIPHLILPSALLYAPHPTLLVFFFVHSNSYLLINCTM